MVVGRTSPSEVVYQAVVDLCNSGRSASRQVVASVTGLKLQIVDDHVKKLIDNGRLRKVVNGVVEPVEQHPPARPISRTVMPDGTCKLEIEDHCIELTPTEQREIGRLFAGDAMQLAHMREERETDDRRATQAAELKNLRRRVHDLVQAMHRLQAQTQQKLL